MYLGSLALAEVVRLDDAIHHSASREEFKDEVRLVRLIPHTI